MEYTKYEIARIIGARALQLSQGAPFMLKLSQKELENLGYNTLKIAKLEFERGVVPITVKRAGHRLANVEEKVETKDLDKSEKNELIRFQK